MSSPVVCPKCGSEFRADDRECPRCSHQSDPDDETTIAETPINDHSPPGRVGDFQILRSIGKGGMGTVYEAFQESMRRNVALKVLDAGLFPSDKQVHRFEREAWIAGRLSHPNIVKVFGQGTEGDTHYIAMELLEGRSLQDAIREAKKQLTKERSSDSAWRAGHFRRMAELFVGVTDALHYVHEQGIVHRDFKPGNLLLADNDSKLLLTDFGLARDVDASRVTRRGDFFGTIRYMSPEQLLAHRVDVDHRSDIYSLGVSLYEAVTLELPLQAESEEAYIQALSTKESVPARKRNPAVPVDLETVLMKCLQRDPEERYSSAEELAADLRRFLDNRPVLARRPGVVLKAWRFLGRNRRTLAITAAAVLVTVLVGGTLLRWSAGRHDLQRIAWTLEQCIERGADVSRIEPDWAGLEKTLWSHVEAHRDGPLDILAHRAACRPIPEIARFALAPEDPNWGVALMNGCGLDEDQIETRGYICYAEIDASWDGAEWTAIRSVLWPSFSGVVTHDTLKPERWGVGPHELRLRARLDLPEEPESWRLALDAPETLLKTINGSARENNPEVTALPTRHHETRDLGEFEVMVFDEFPENFPRAVPADELDEELHNGFRLDAIQVLRVNLPEGPSNGFWVDDNRVRPDRCLPDQTDWTGDMARALRGLIINVRLKGHFDTRLSIPLAAEGTLWIDSEPVLSFVLVWGDGLGEVAGVTSGLHWHSELFGGKVQTDVGTDLGHGPRWSQGDYPPPSETLSDGEHRGTIVLEPSRDVALGTRRFTRYFGESVELPVTVEVETRNAVRKQREHCWEYDGSYRHGGHH